MMPCCRIESISSCSASRAKSLRGCSALGTIFAKLIWCTLSPGSPVSGRVATDGVPINAPSPLPRPDRAMLLRLREQFHQRKQQSPQRAHEIGEAGLCERQLLAEISGSVRVFSGRTSNSATEDTLTARGAPSPFAGYAPSLYKSLKKCIDTGRRNSLSHAPGSEQAEDFYPVNSSLVRILGTQKQNKQPGEKEHTQSMYPLNQLKTLVSCGRDPARSLPFRRGFLLIPLILVCLGLLPAAQAAPAPETPDPGAVPGFFTTADGRFALLSLTTGQGNSAFGALSLFVDTTGNFNTGVGAGTLALNNADSNTAVGTVALLLNTTGANNTAVGSAALVNNLGEITPGDLNGSFNNAVGANALRGNTTGSSNNAVGESALFSNTIGAANTAVGDVALESNDSSGLGLGNANAAVGAGALFSNGDGDSNNAVGFNALGGNVDGLFNNVVGFDAMADNVSGAGNVAVGDSAGAGVEGDFNIYIGAFAGPAPGPTPTAESETIRIGDVFNVACFIGGISGVPVS